MVSMVESSYVSRYFNVLRDRLLSSSPWSETYCAETRNGVLYAVTLFDPTCFVSSHARTGWSELRVRLKPLRDHDYINVAKQSLMSKSEEPPWFAEPYTKGVDLSQRLRISGGLPLVLAAMRLQDVIVGLEAVLPLGITHGGLGPTCIWLQDENARTFVTQFGVLPMLRTIPEFHDKHMVQDSFTSVACYLAPEFLDAQQLVDTRSDVYSLGTLFYEMVTGARFHDVRTMADLHSRHLQQQTGGLTAVHHSLPPQIVEPLGRALRHNPEARYQCPAEFLKALSDALGPDVFLSGEDAELAELVYAEEHPPEVRERLEELLQQRRQGLQATEEQQKKLIQQQISATKTRKVLDLIERDSRSARDRILQAKAEWTTVATERQTHETVFDRVERVWSHVRVQDTVASFQRKNADSFKVCAGRVHAFAFQPKGKYVAIAGDDQNLQVRELERSEERDGRAPVTYTLVPFTSRDGAARQVTAMDFSPDGRLLAVSSHDGTVRIWGTENWELLYEPLRGHKNIVYRVRFNATGDLLVSGSQDGLALVWSVASGDLVARLAPDTDWVYGVTFCRTSNGVVTAGANGVLKLWEFDARGEATCAEFEPQPLQKDAPHLGESAKRPGILDVVFDSAGKMLTAGDQEGKVVFWDFTTRKPLDFELVRDRASGAPVRRLAFSPDGGLLACGRTDDSVSIWRMDNGALTRSLRPHKGSVQDLAFHPHESCLLGTVGDDGCLKLYS